MIFKNIFGQEQAIDLLSHDLDNENIAHAYLFSGQLGIGKTKTALRFAKAIACPSGGCLKCAVCKSFENKVHPDFQFIKAEGNYISIDQIRRLAYWVSLKSSQAKRKIVIIEEAERMTEEAANALLKTLEDPLESVVFLCITSNKNAVLPTIISRCRHVKFRALAHDALVDYFKDKGQSSEKVRLAAGLSQGVFGKALQLIEDEDIWDFRSQVIDCLKDVFLKPTEQSVISIEEFFVVIKKFQKRQSGSEHIDVEGLPPAAVKNLKKQAKRKDAARNQRIILQALDFWWFWLRDMVVFCETGEKDSLINIDYFDEIAKRCQNNEVRKSWYLMQRIPIVKERIKQNINPQLALEELLLCASELVVG